MGLVLVGYRGCGKTTVGRLIAGRWGLRLIDTDALIVESAGMPIREVFASRGETYFRELETAALRRAIGEEKTVISTGGGIVMLPENREMIRASQSVVVYLHADAQTLYERISGDADSHANRPNLTALGGGFAEVQHLLEIRDPLYREAADLIVDVAGKSPEEIVEEVIRGCERARHQR